MSLDGELHVFDDSLEVLRGVLGYEGEGLGEVRQELLSDRKFGEHLGEEGNFLEGALLLNLFDVDLLEEADEHEFLSLPPVGVDKLNKIWCTDCSSFLRDLRSFLVVMLVTMLLICMKTGVLGLRYPASTIYFGIIFELLYNIRSSHSIPQLPKTNPPNS